MIISSQILRRVERDVEDLFGPETTENQFGPVFVDNYLPTVFYPPGFEDPNNHNVIVFRDLGTVGMRELRQRDGYAVWHPSETGDWRSSGSLEAEYPFPAETLGSELIHLYSSSDQSAVLKASDRTPVTNPPQFHDKTSSMMWAFRLFVDRGQKRVRMLTHRGDIWEIGSEAAGILGDECTADSDCLEGVCADGVCCDSRCAGTCQSCDGANKGKCEVVADGTPDPACGSGECAPVCVRSGAVATCQSVPNTPCGSGASCEGNMLTAASSCQHHPSPTNPSLQVFGCVRPSPTQCAGGLSCQDGVAACKSTCTNREDCGTGLMTCDATTGVCVPDAVSVLAASMGVEPKDAGPLELVTPEELAIAFETVGYPRKNGVYTNPALSQGGLTIGFDPAVKAPIVGLRYCILSVMSCISVEDQRSPDECVAGAPRCSTDKPWLGTDPEGLSCCPEECLLDYLNDRGAGLSDAEAMSNLIYSGCYPGIEPGVR